MRMRMDSNVDSLQVVVSIAGEVERAQQVCTEGHTHRQRRQHGSCSQYRECRRHRIYRECSEHGTDSGEGTACTCAWWRVRGDTGREEGGPHLGGTAS